MKRIVFMGTPEAAVPALEMLSASYEVALVVTQPDRPRGRSSALEAPPVKGKALELGLPVEQPQNAPDLLAALHRSGQLDVGVVVAYGRILRPEVLALPESGMVNVHFSLLPRWRGAAPVNRALMAGDEMSGVTLIQMDDGLDTGPVLTAQAVDIGSNEDAGELTTRLSTVGARLLVDNLDRFLDGELSPVRQSSEGLEYASKIGPEDRPIDLTLQPFEIVNHVRGLAPSPGATIEIDGQTHKILAAELAPETVPVGTWESREGWPIVGLNAGSVRLMRLQSPGRSVVAGDEWARGRRSDGGLVA